MKKNNYFNITFLSMLSFGLLLVGNTYSCFSMLETIEEAPVAHMEGDVDAIVTDYGKNESRKEGNFKILTVSKGAYKELYELMLIKNKHNKSKVQGAAKTLTVLGGEKYFVKLTKEAWEDSNLEKIKSLLLKKENINSKDISSSIVEIELGSKNERNYYFNIPGSYRPVLLEEKTENVESLEKEIENEKKELKDLEEEYKNKKIEFGKKQAINIDIRRLKEKIAKDEVKIKKRAVKRGDQLLNTQMISVSFMAGDTSAFDYGHEIKNDVNKMTEFGEILGTTLALLHNKIEGSHGDLHLNNVRFTRNGENIKEIHIIDVETAAWHLPGNAKGNDDYAEKVKKSYKEIFKGKIYPPYKNLDDLLRFIYTIFGDNKDYKLFSKEQIKGRLVQMFIKKLFESYINALTKKRLEEFKTHLRELRQVRRERGFKFQNGRSAFLRLDEIFEIVKIDDLINNTDKKLEKLEKQLEKKLEKKLEIKISEQPLAYDDLRKLGGYGAEPIGEAKKKLENERKEKLENERNKFVDFKKGDGERRKQERIEKMKKKQEDKMKKDQKEKEKHKKRTEELIKRKREREGK